MDSIDPLVIPPFGVSPFGLFDSTPATIDRTPPPGILADSIDYGNRDPSKDPSAATFEFTSIFRGMHPVDEQVCVALSRIRNSGAAVQNDGADFLAIGKLGTGAKSLLESEARTALRRLVLNGDVEIISVVATIIDDSAWVEASYRNLRAPNRKVVRKQKRRFQEWVGVEVSP